jgi:hypothetical protein
MSWPRLIVWGVAVIVLRLAAGSPARVRGFPGWPDVVPPWATPTLMLAWGLVYAWGRCAETKRERAS